MTARPISLHVERLVIDEGLVAPGEEGELHAALVEALEQLLPGAIAGVAAGYAGQPASPRDTGPAGDAASRAPVPAGRPSLLAAGVAERVAAHVSGAVAAGGGTR